MSLFRRKRPSTRPAGSERGSVLLEAALVMPIVVLFIAGIADYGVTLYQYHTLSTANGSAVRQLVVSRGFDNPYAGVLGQYATWAPGLKVKSSQITVSVTNADGDLQACTDDTSPNCKTLLDGAAGKQGQIAVDYACITTFIPSMASPCPIKVTASGLIE